MESQEVELLCFAKHLHSSYHKDQLVPEKTQPFVRFTCVERDRKGMVFSQIFMTAVTVLISRFSAPTIAITLHYKGLITLMLPAMHIESGVLLFGAAAIFCAPLFGVIESVCISSLAPYFCINSILMFCCVSHGTLINKLPRWGSIWWGLELILMNKMNRLSLRSR